MQSRSDILKNIIDGKIIAVVRLSDSIKAVPMTKSLVNGGVKNIEITLTSHRALNIISTLSKTFSGEALIGVGSVINAEQAEESIKAGADYVVSPVTRPEIIEMAHKYDKPAIIGAFSPTEILYAWESGADLIKVFPATKLGPQYFKDVHGPLPDIPLVPTGGVELSNAADFLKAKKSICKMKIGEIWKNWPLNSCR